MFPIGLLFVAATVWMVFMARGRRCGGRGFLSTLGIVSVLAGLFVFGMHSSRDRQRHVELVEVEHPAQALENLDIRLPQIDIRLPQMDVINPDVEIEFDRGFPFHHREPESRLSRGPLPKWMVVSLGSLLLIIGALLATRDRPLPKLMKALTVLGAGAVVYSLVSFFNDSPRLRSQGDRIVRVDSQGERRSQRIEGVRAGKPPSAAQDGRRAKRPSRARRPAAEEPAVAALPPRAGSIPVEAELAKSQASQSEVSVETAPAPQSTAAASAPSDSGAKAAAPAAAAEADTAPPADSATPAAAPAEAAAPETPTPSAPPAVAPPEQPAPVAPRAPVAPEAPAAATPPAGPPAQAPSATGGSRTTPLSGQARPAWVDTPARLSNGVYSLPVRSGLFVSLPECQHELDAQLKQEADHYIDEYVGEQASQLVNIPLSYLKAHVKKAEYAEVVHSDTVGPMHQIHALLEFDDQARSDFRRLWHNAVVTDRLWYAGSGTALVLALLATVYGYLRLDLRTAPAHRGRLQLAATLVALIVAAGALLARWAVPF